VAGFLLAPLSVLASGDEPATALQRHVDTSNLGGANLLLATLYNEHRVLYAVVTTMAMAVFGTAIAFALDAVMDRLGVRVSKVERRE
jgi:ABC-type phosphate/phosphonate transport system permease subunit